MNEMKNIQGVYYKCVHQWSSIINVKLTEKDGNRQLEIFLSFFWNVQICNIVPCKIEPCRIKCGNYSEKIEFGNEAADDERVIIFFFVFNILLVASPLHM